MLYTRREKVRMGLFDVFSFKKEAQKVFNKEKHFVRDVECSCVASYKFSTFSFKKS